MSNTIRRVFSIICVLLFAVASLKILFVGYDIDEQYAAAMSYRMVQGDFLLLDMWEPHQTSGFLAAMLMLPYLSIFRTTVGIVLYLRVCGMILHLFVTSLFFCYLKANQIPGQARFFISAIFYFSLPKLMFFPDFANMQIWFLMVMLLCLARHYRLRGEIDVNAPRIIKGRRFVFMFIAGIFMALEVLAYPLTLPVFPACMICIALFRDKSGKVSLRRELFAFCIPCITGAAGLILLLLSRMDIGTFFRMIRMVLRDGSHAAPLGERLYANLLSIGEIGLVLCVYAVITGILFLLILRRKIRFCPLLLLVTFAGQIVFWVCGNHYPNYPLAEYIIVPLMGLWMFVKKKIRFNYTFAFFILIPLIAFLGIVIATNHPLQVSAPFLGICVAGVLSAPELWEQDKPLRPFLTPVLCCWFLMIVFGKCYMVRTTGGVHYTMFDSVKLIRQGPAAGILADEETVIDCRDKYELVENVIPEGAAVFYIGSANDLYLVKKMAICTPSTISTPSFDEKYTLYFALHPQKEPEYVLYDKSSYNAIISPWVQDYLAGHCEPEHVAENDYLLVFRAVR